MSASVLYMSMSLDGYFVGPKDELGHGFATSGCPDRASDLEPRSSFSDRAGGGASSSRYGACRSDSAAVP